MTAGYLRMRGLGQSDLFCTDGEPADRLCPTPDMCYYECPTGEAPRFPASPRLSMATLTAWLQRNSSIVLGTAAGFALLAVLRPGGRR